MCCSVPATSSWKRRSQTSIELVCSQAGTQHIIFPLKKEQELGSSDLNFEEKDLDSPKANKKVMDLDIPSGIREEVSVPSKARAEAKAAQPRLGLLDHFSTPMAGFSVQPIAGNSQPIAGTLADLIHSSEESWGSVPPSQKDYSIVFLGGKSMLL
jgi:hypothetical protein